MNFATGVGLGALVGAYAGKKLQPQIRRELEALRQDVAYEYELHKSGHIDFDEFIAHENTYPSVYRRVQDFYYKCYRGVRNVRYFPDEVKYVYQRARRGWADHDLWDADNYIVDLLVGMLQRYKIAAIGYPADTTEEAWDARIDEIIWGLRQYQMFMSEGHTTAPEDYMEAQDAALRALKRSFELLGEDLPGIWI